MKMIKRFLCVHRSFADAFIAVSTKELFKYASLKKLVHMMDLILMCMISQGDFFVMQGNDAQNDGDKYLDLLKGLERALIYMIVMVTAHSVML